MRRIVQLSSIERTSSQFHLEYQFEAPLIFSLSTALNRAFQVEYGSAFDRPPGAAYQLRVPQAAPRQV